MTVLPEDGADERRNASECQSVSVKWCMKMVPPLDTFRSPQCHNTVDFKNQLTILERCKGKGNILSVQTIQAYRGSRGIAPHILSLGTKWKGVVNFAPRLLYIRKRTRYHWKEGWVGCRARLGVLYNGQTDNLQPVPAVQPSTCSWYRYWAHFL